METTDPQADAAQDAARLSKRARLREVAAVFLRLGFTAFGGPAAHLALMEDEVVTRRKWIGREEFLELYTATNFIPGPNSTELAIHLGHVRAGWPGLLVAGVCFIVPAVLIILPLAWAYVRFGTVPQAQGPMHAAVACVIGIVAVAGWRFARSAVKDWFTGIIAAAAFGAAFWLTRLGFAQTDLIILAFAAAAGGTRAVRRAPPTAKRIRNTMWPILGGASPLAVGSALSSKLLAMTLTFLKVGATLFGSGYVLVSYLRNDLVLQHQWLRDDQLMVAIGVGQVTPGPLLTTATFIGFLLGHQWSGGNAAVATGGALLATVGIFLPSFVFVAILAPLWPRLRSSQMVKGALVGMNAAVVALILVVSIQLAQRTIFAAPTSAGVIGGSVIAVLSMIVLLVWNLNSTWLILASIAIGWLLKGAI